MIPKLQDVKHSPIPNVLTDTQASLIASLIYIGCIPGPYIVGWLSNMKGRRPCFVLGGVIGTIGYLLLATTRTLVLLYIGRLMTGVGIGCIFLMILVYTGEIASTNIRGVLLTLIGLFTTIGSIVLFSAASFLSYNATSYLGFILFATFTLCAFMLPESPMYHVLKENDNAVEKILRDLDRLEDLEKFISSKKDYKTISSKKDWEDLFTIKSNRKALFRVMSINILQHCSGVMAVVFFSSTIFEIAESKIEGNTAMIIIGGCQLLGSGFTPFVIEKVGRKPILMISCVICSITMLMMGIYFYLLDVENSAVGNMKWLPLGLLILFFIGYDLGLGIIPNVLVGEMFTPNVRSNGSSLALTTSWISGFLITTAFGAVVNKIGAFYPFWFFSFTSAITFFFTIFFVPETKGKNLLDIQKDLQG
ncbi:facilitated trehalose transporter Tret1-like isoform X2 [Danaus plexippus]|nr:facilitated trehalose transporter Tret1-like isoform X2 [Danaus plexippus]